MILVDTSVWIEFFRSNQAIFSVLAPEIERQNALAVECVFGELLQGVQNSRESAIISDYWNNLPRIDESGLWIEAGTYSGKNKLFAKGIGLIDVFLIAVAKKHRAKLWTLDKKLLSALQSAEIFTTA